ncbi:hypothetical protein C8R46DRAFT_1194846 [Mycena filopes]|nr:hypothetical protein C8R46DRAFT_1194846 [Mycena filopes]
MSQRTEKDPLNGTMPDSNPEDENAAAKLWAVYVSEAEKYDKSLVESWKSDMKGMLIFAGLFSASLTAFLIESYKTLVPDSGDATVLLLAQISHQLAASANGTTFNFVAPAPFTPLRSSLVCNVLWFISLGLSLTCALIATLLEQWARDFLHKTEIRSAPVIRARVFSYLYYGLKKFGMHTVVEIIPLLLHASLFFFFAGLVAFLIPINAAITAVAAAILGMVTSIYTILTVLPLSHPDCPYQTPLSGGFWNLRRSLSTIFPWAQASTETMVESVFRASTTPSAERNLRDQAALVWTVKSLTDNTELEPLLEALPDVLWGRDGRRRLYDTHIRRIIDDPDSDLLARVRDFLHNCYSGVLPAEVAKRRQISYYKAIWVLGSVSAPGHAVQIPVPHLFQIDLEVAPYYTSARAIQEWADLCAAKPLLDRTLALLKRYIDRRNPELIRQIHLSLQQLDSVHDVSFLDSEIFAPSSDLVSSTALSSAAQSIADRIIDRPLHILLRYLSDPRTSNHAYRFDETQRLLSPPPSTTFSTYIVGHVENALYGIVRHKIRSIMEEEGLTWMDDVFAKIVSYWEPRGGPVPSAILEYLGTRKCDEAVRRALLAVSDCGWQRVPDIILHRPTGDDVLATGLNVIWRICAHQLELGPPWSLGTLATWEATLAALWEIEQRSAAPAVVAMVKQVILEELDWALNSLVGHDLILSFNKPLRLTPSFSLSPEGIMSDEPSEEEMRRILQHRYSLADLDNLTEFLQQCSSNNLLINPGETMRAVGNFAPRPGIPPEHQLRFATAVNELFTQGTANLLAEFSRLRIWWAYREVPRVDAWLDDAEARDLVQKTLRAYLETLPPHDKLFTEINQIVTTMDHRHSPPRNDSQ